MPEVNAEAAGNPVALARGYASYNTRPAATVT